MTADAYEAVTDTDRVIAEIGRDRSLTDGERLARLLKHQAFLEDSKRGVVADFKAEIDKTKNAISQLRDAIVTGQSSLFAVPEE